MAGRALVVDDSATMRQVLATWLTVLGWDVEEAEDGRAALDRLEAGAPPLLVTDNDMPHMTGLELVRAVRARTGTQPRIVMVTADSTLCTVQQAMDAGVDEYLMKPLTMDAFESKLELLLTA